MSRSWFYASEGQQQGPYPEDQLRDLSPRGTVRPGYAGVDRGHGRLAEGRRNSRPDRRGGRRAADDAAIAGPHHALVRGGGYGAGSLSVDFGILGVHSGGASCILIGFVLIIPAPWVVVWYYRGGSSPACGCRGGRISASPARP